MKAYKNDVIRFVIAVKNKATKTIKEKYDKQIDAKYEAEMFTNPKYSLLITSIQDEAVRIADDLSKLHSELSNNAIRTANHYDIVKDDISYATTILNIEQHIRQTFTIESIKKLTIEKNNKVKQTELAYDDIERKIKGMKSVPKMIDYLKELGFDTAKIETETVPGYDETVLFPCKFQEGEAKND